MNSLTDKEKAILDSIFHDLQILFGRDEIKSEEIDAILKQMESEEAKSYINSLREAKPETALSDAFFAGRSILKKYLFETATPEAIVGDGFIDFKVKAFGEKVILVELKPLFESKTRKVKAGRELVSLKQTELKPENHKEQILKYIHGGGEYIVLTNLKKWFFFNKSVTAAEFEPFASADLMEFHKEFEVERNLWDYLTRLDKRSIREDLDALFFRSLQMWVSKLSEVEFTVDENKKTELIITLINKFIFVQTLDDYRVIEPRWIQETWGHNERRWASKGKAKVLREFFEDVDNWFYQYYDTELFRHSVLDHVNQSRLNLELLHKNLRLVLGLEYWMSALGGFRGIMQYNFRFIDEDILGKAYETYLAGVRHDEGIYYTPKFVTQYIVENTVGNKLEGIVNKIRESLEKERFEKAMELVAELTSVRVLDPACGSGSFLIKAVRKIMEKYKEVQVLLQKLEKKHDRWQGSLHRPKEVEKKVEKIHQITEILGPRNNREIIARILVRHIHGNDKDSKALDVAKVNLWLEAIKLSPADFRYDRLPRNTNYVLPNLQMNFCCGDSVVGLPEDQTVESLSAKHKKDLTELCELRRRHLAEPSDPALVEKIVKIRSQLKKKINEEFVRYLSEKGLPVEILDETTPLHWALEFWYLYFDRNGLPFPQKCRGADIVIGNPPYERIQVLVKKAPIYVKYLNKCGFKSAFRNYDLATIFVERGFNLLRHGGEFGYIVSNKFVQADYGEAIRGFLAKEKAVRQLVDFGDQQVFDDATTYTVLTFLSSKPTETFRYALVKKLERTIDQLLKAKNNEELDEPSISVLTQETGALSEKPWVFALRDEGKILEKLEKKKKIEDVCRRIFQGLVTGADPVFILKLISEENALVKVFSKSMNKEYILEKDLVKPLLKGKDIIKWTVEETDEVILFPYTIRDGKAKLIDGKTFETRYPRTWKYLLDNRQLLESRERGKWTGVLNWYAYGRRQNLEQFDQPKIMTQVLADQSSFAVDDVGFYYFVGGGNAGGYGIVLKSDQNLSLPFVCGLLNSSVVDWNLKKISTRFRGGFYSYARRYLERLPIEIPLTKRQRQIKSSVESLVGQIIGHKKAEKRYKELWNYWSAKLKGKEYVLGKILEEDFKNVREGAFEKTWTKDVTFYPYQEKDILSQEYSRFRIVGEKEQGIIKMFGLDESNREELVYQMEFKDNNLMEHVYASIVSVLDSRKKVKRLSDILLKTTVPVITPNPLQQTPNITKKVEKEFHEWKQRNKLTDAKSESLCEIHNNIQSIEAKIDSLVFVLYGLDRKEVAIVLESLSLPSSYQERVRRYLDEIDNLVR